VRSRVGEHPRFHRVCKGAPEANCTWPDRPGCWCENVTSPAAAVIAPRALLRPGALREEPCRRASVALRSHAAWVVEYGDVATDVVMPDAATDGRHVDLGSASDADPGPQSSDEQPELEPRQSRAACRATGEKHVVRGAMQRSAAASVPAGPMQSRAVATIRGSARTPLTLPYSHVADGRRAARTPNASLV